MLPLHSDTVGTQKYAHKINIILQNESQACPKVSLEKDIAISRFHLINTFMSHISVTGFCCRVLLFGAVFLFYVLELFLGTCVQRVFLNKALC